MHANNKTANPNCIAQLEGKLHIIAVHSRSNWAAAGMAPYFSPHLRKDSSCPVRNRAGTAPHSPYSARCCDNSGRTGRRWTGRTGRRWAGRTGRRWAGSTGRGWVSWGRVRPHKAPRLQAAASSRPASLPKTQPE